MRLVQQLKLNVKQVHINHHLVKHHAQIANLVITKIRKDDLVVCNVQQGPIHLYCNLHGVINAKKVNIHRILQLNVQNAFQEDIKIKKADLVASNVLTEPITHYMDKFLLIHAQNVLMDIINHLLDNNNVFNAILANFRIIKNKHHAKIAPLGPIIRKKGKKIVNHAQKANIKIIKANLCVNNVYPVNIRIIFNNQCVIPVQKGFIMKCMSKHQYLHAKYVQVELIQVWELDFVYNALLDTINLKLVHPFASLAQKIHIILRLDLHLQILVCNAQMDNIQLVVLVVAHNVQNHIHATNVKKDTI